MKILITGAQGLLGQDLVSSLSAVHQVVGTGRRRPETLSIPYHPGDLRDQSFVETLILRERPEVILHTAALTHVDYCEQHPDEAHAINVTATKLLAEAAVKQNSFFVFFSTDYVFNGAQSEPYQEMAPQDPLNIYGKSKALAESMLSSIAGLAYAIFRVSWLYGHHGKSFPKTILKKALENQLLSVVDDQRGRPTFTWDLAQAFKELFDRNPKSLKMLARSIFHLANQGTATWYDFSKFILEETGFKPDVRAILSSELNLPAKRPENSVLSLTKAEHILNLQLRHWQDAAKEFVAELPPEMKGLYASQSIGS